MSIFVNSIVIFAQIFILTIFVSLSGYVFRKLVINLNHLSKFEEDGLYGFIFIGFISLLLNFFIPLNILHNSLFFVLITSIGVYFGFFNQNKKLIFNKSILISFIAFVLIIYSNVNRPDAWLYHLPYSSILNEHKIILGVANIHERFAHISIFQYISSFFYNHFFLLYGILIPISLVASFFFVYVFKEFNENFLSKSKTVYSYLGFLILILSLYAFNRYSEYGNDAQSHLYYFFFTLILFKYLLLKKSIDTLKELSVLSVFIFLMKPTFILVAIIPLFLFLNLNKKNKLIKSFSFFFSCVFFILWIFKNFLTTGCVIYPLTLTCFEKVSWKVNNLEQNIIVNEAWSKGWPDQKKDKVLKKTEYVKNFNWIETWSKNHFLFIFEKILPVLIFLILNFLFFYFTKSLKKNIYEKNLLFLFIFNLCFLFLWFTKFPVYRLGISQVYICFILISYFIFIKNLNPIRLSSLYKYIKSFIYFAVIVVLLKNSIRILDNSNNQLMPNIYYGTNNKDRIEKIYNKEDIFTHYSTKDNDLCGYSKSPCTHIDRNFLVSDYLGYKIYSVQ